MTKPNDNGKTGTPAGGSTVQDKFINLWDVIEIGGTVLWQADPGEGYFPCNVVGISKDRKMLTLKWRDYPKLPSFQAKRIAVGLISVIE